MNNGNHSTPNPDKTATPKTATASTTNPNKPVDWDAIDQANADSFPASDPPAHGTFRAAPSAASADAVADKKNIIETVEDTVAANKAMIIKIAIGAGIGLAAIGAVVLVAKLATREPTPWWKQIL